jgi:hypothetical protein
MTTIDPARLRELSARADRDDLIYGPDRDVLARRAAAKALRWRCVETGQDFPDAAKAAQAIGAQPGAVSMARQHGLAVLGKYHFVRNDLPAVNLRPTRSRGSVVNLTTLDVYPNITAAARAVSGGTGIDRRVRTAHMAILRSIRFGRSAYGGEWVRLRTARRVLGLVRRRESEAACA